MMSACENPHMHWERNGRWHQAWIQIRKMCMKEQKKTQTRTSHCSTGKFGVPFLSCSDRWDLRLQIANTTFCYTSSVSLGTQAASDHYFAARLELICSTGAPQCIGWAAACLPQLSEAAALCSAAALGPSYWPQWSFPGHSGEPDKTRAAGAVQGKKSKTSKPCKWSWKTETLQNI